MNNLYGFVCLILLSTACSKNSFKAGVPNAAAQDANGEGLPTPSTTPGTTTDSNTIEFGGSAVYRVGNGMAQDTSCKETVEAHDLEGTTYSFQFEVLEDNTNLNFSIGKLCGIDIPDSNYISVVDQEGRDPLIETILDKRVVDEANPFRPFDRELNLNKGVYAIKVISDRNRRNRDNDDFIIGEIKIEANKPVRGKEIKTDKS